MARKITIVDFAKKSFAISGNLRDHIKRIHDKNQKNHKCDICDKSFVTTGDNNKHIKRVQASDELNSREIQ